MSPDAARGLPCMCVQYTDRCSALRPVEVMTLLNALYSEFDQLSEQHGVYKVETIGGESSGEAKAARPASMPGMPGRQQAPAWHASCKNAAARAPRSVELALQQPHISPPWHAPPSSRPGMATLIPTPGLPCFPLFHADAFMAVSVSPPSVGRGLMAARMQAYTRMRVLPQAVPAAATMSSEQCACGCLGRMCACRWDACMHACA